MPRSLTHDDYTVGILCTTSVERTAMEAMFDHTHPHLRSNPQDTNIYSFGSIGVHNVVLASPGATRSAQTSSVGSAVMLRRAFFNLRIRLLVGIADGIPRPDEVDGDIRLGDIVVGTANGMPSVVDYTFGAATEHGFEIRSEVTDPPAQLQSAVSALYSQHSSNGPTYLVHLANMLRTKPQFNRPDLPRQYYNAPNARDSLMKLNPRTRTEHEVARRPRHLAAPPHGLGAQRFISYDNQGCANYPKVFYGSIGSGAATIRSAKHRDEIYDMVRTQRRAKLLCLESEAAGVVRTWPCLVIRGICNYSDSHSNDAWQNFAAATAAAYAKDLICRVPPEMPDGIRSGGHASVSEKPKSGMRRMFASR